MALENGKFDVRVRSVPPRTPQGEEFAPALARAFGVELWMAEHLVRSAPAFVKRAVTFEIAERLCASLERLGAKVDIVEANAGETRSDPAPGPGMAAVPSLPVRSVAASSWPPGLPSIRPSEPVPAPPGALPSEWRYPSPPPRPSARGSSSIPPSAPPPAHPAAHSAHPSHPSPPSTPLTVRPTAPPTARTWTPLPPPPRPSGVGTGTVLLGAAAAIALVFVGFTHWLRSVGDAKMLGNTPAEETLVAGHYGLTGPGIDPDRRAKLTLVVAWHAGCLSEDYARFLQDLADAHRGELAVLGAGLSVPASHDPRALGKVPVPPPDPWPPKGCEPGIEVLPIGRGYVSDFLAAPATYLYDSDGALIAAWRGGMSPIQRERLATWLDGKTWDH